MSEALNDYRTVQLRDGTWRMTRTVDGFPRVIYGATEDEVLGKLASDIRRERIGPTPVSDAAIARLAEWADESADPLWTEYLATVRAKLERGAAEYGDGSFARDRGRLLSEIQEECVDITGWSWVLRVACPEDERRARQLAMEGFASWRLARRAAIGPHYTPPAEALR
jgi:hypothetical protein